jgi:hypothetical protein
MTDDQNETPQTFTCQDCGHQWKQGLTGAHDCHGNLKKLLTDALAKLKDAEKENAHLCNELAACEEQMDRNAELCEAARADLSAVTRERDHLQGYVIPEKDNHGKFWEDLAQERLAQLSRLQAACGEKDQQIKQWSARLWFTSRIEGLNGAACAEIVTIADEMDKAATSGDTLGEEGKSDRELSTWLRSKLSEAETALRAREQMEKSWRSGTDESWEAAAKMHPSTADKPPMTRAQRLKESEAQGRIALKCRKDVEMLRAVLSIIDPTAIRAAMNAASEGRAPTPQ